MGLPVPDTPRALVRVLGIGSPFGDDQLGWRAIEYLAADGLLQRLPPGLVSLSCHDRPGASLMDAMEGAQLAILIDAVCGGAPQGAILRVEGEQIEAQHGLLSSHGFGVAAALALGRALGHMPQRVVLWGMEVGPLPPQDPDAPLSAILRDALPQLATCIEQEIQRFLSSADTKSR